MSSKPHLAVLAKRIVSDLLTRDGMKIGIGSGTTIVYVIDEISAAVKRQQWSSMRFIPTSYQSRMALLDAGLSSSTLDEFPQLDLTIDGADAIDSELTLIKGGGGAHVQEKIVAACSRELHIVAVVDKFSPTDLCGKWDRGIPLEVLPMVTTPLLARIPEKLGGRAELRQAVAKMGPVVTDNGNFIIDWHPPTIITKSTTDKRRNSQDWGSIDIVLRSMPGIVGTGLFIGMCQSAYLVDESNNVTVLKR